MLRGRILKMHNQVEKSERYLLVDALRGIAALAVVLHHLFNSTVMTATLKETFPVFLQDVCNFGSLGVEVFLFLVVLLLLIRSGIIL